jgi:uncharacterized MAPEG superfamily protein
MDLLVRNNEATAFMSTTNGGVVAISEFISQLGILGSNFIFIFSKLTYTINFLFDFPEIRSLQ